MNTAKTKAVERGAASILIELRDGNITVTHGTDKAVLGIAKDALPGSWDLLWETLRAIGVK